MNSSVYHFYTSPEYWGRFNHYLHRIVNTYNNITIKAKLCDAYIRITLENDTKVVRFMLPIEYYNAMTEELKNNNYFALTLEIFKHDLRSLIWDAFYNPKYN